MTALRRLVATLATLATLALATLVLPAPAAAHVTVASSSPADGTDLVSLPAQVSVAFDEPVGLDAGYVQVVDAAGARVDTGPVRHPGGHDATVEVGLRPVPDAPGGYLVSFRVVSADGHPVAGSIRFTVAGGTAPVAASPVVATSALLGALIAFATGLAYLGLAAAGGAWLVVSRRAGVLDSRRTRTLVRGGLLLAAAATVVQIALQGPYVAGDDTRVGAGRLLLDTLDSPFGVARCVELAALVGLLALSVPLARLHGPLRGAREIAVVGAVLLWSTAIGAMVASGHARVRAPAWLSLTSSTLHVLAVTTWLGGLLLLVVLVLPAGDRTGTPVLLARFSRVALASVTVLALTGTFQAWQQTRSWAALGTTTYGALLLVKTGLLAVLVALGAVARRHVRRAHPARALRRGVLVELAVLVAALGVTSVLVSQPPAQVAYAAALTTRPATATVDLDAGRSATVRVDPARPGPVTITVTLTGVGPGASVTLEASLPARRIGPLTVALTPLGADTWVATGVDLPGAGPWTLHLGVRTSTFAAVVATETVTLRSGV